MMVRLRRQCLKGGSIPGSIKINLLSIVYLMNYECNIVTHSCTESQHATELARYKRTFTIHLMTNVFVLIVPSLTDACYCRS